MDRALAAAQGRARRADREMRDRRSARLRSMAPPRPEHRSRGQPASRRRLPRLRYARDSRSHAVGAADQLSPRDRSGSNLPRRRPRRPNRRQPRLRCRSGPPAARECRVRPGKASSTHVRKTRPLSPRSSSTASSEGARPSTEAGDVALVSLPPGEATIREQLQSRATARSFSRFCQGIFRQADRASSSSPKAGGESRSPRKERDQETRESRARARPRRAIPIIMEAEALFGGELGPIELIQERASC